MTIPVLLAHGATTADAQGGGPGSLITIAAHLDRSRFEPVALCPAPGELSNRLQQGGVRVVVQRNKPFAKRTAAQFLLDALKLRQIIRRNGIRVVHSNSGKGRHSSLVLAARLAGVPYIQHLRAPLNGGPPDAIGFRWASRIIANSGAVAEPLRRDPRFCQKTVVVHNGIDFSVYAGTEDRREELPPKRGPVIGFAGRIVERKCLPALLRAFASVRLRFPDALLVVLGGRSEKYPEHAAYCRRLSDELGLNGDVLFLGYRCDVAAWMKTFDVFVLPARNEAFGKVVVEAMAAGCPVVAANDCGVPEIITGPELGRLVPPDDPDATAEAIEGYLGNPDEARRVGERAAEVAHERFSVEQMVRQIEEIYLDVLGGSPAAEREFPEGIGASNQEIPVGT